MANPDAPRGLTPISNKNGGPYNGAVRSYYIQDGYATDLFRGDPIVRVSDGSNDIAIERPGGGTFPIGTLPVVERGAAGGPFSGTIIGFLVNIDDLKTTYGKANTRRVALVSDDPNLLFTIQEGGGGTPLTATAVGLNASVLVGSGSIATGLSGFMLDNTTVDTTASLELRIIGLVNEPNNAVGLNANWLVALNNHTEDNSGVGI